MDAFFAISSPIPVDEPVASSVVEIEDILVDSEGLNYVQHSGCVIA